ncbi:MAG: ECF transporter S component [Eubacteriales bacterium]|nr:ECF transporter S component [Eubacteriales bacterium]
MNVLIFIVQVVLIVGLIALVAYLIEKNMYAKRNMPMPGLTTKKITMIGLFSAVSGVLMLFEMPMPFAPPFYKVDISEVPVLILTFAYGPVSGIICEMLKVFIKLIIKGTTTAFVGDFANFIVGASFIIPAGIIYVQKKTKKQAIIACVVGTLVLTVFGSMLNAVYLIPKFAELYGMPIDAIVGMATAINPAANTVNKLVLMCVVPLNLVKGAVDTFITILLYKKLSIILKK